MKLSVVIPTFRRPDSLLRGLRSLQAQSLDELEIVVVDNAAQPEVAERVAELNRCARLPATYIAEPRTGVHFARNHGAQAAGGDLLLYTDDDVTFAEEWAEAYRDAFLQHPGLAAAGGPVSAAWETTPPRWLLKLIGDEQFFTLLSLLAPYPEFRFLDAPAIYSCNMAIRRDVLLERGGFHPEATEQGWIGDGETGLLEEMLAAGDRLGHVPEALTHHHIPPGRMSRRYLLRREWNGGSCIEFERFRQGVPGLGGLGLRAARVTGEVMRFAGKAVARGPLRGDRFAVLRAQLELARGAGRLHYLLRLAREPQLRGLVTQRGFLDPV